MNEPFTEPFPALKTESWIAFRLPVHFGQAISCCLFSTIFSKWFIFLRINVSGERKIHSKQRAEVWLLPAVQRASADRAADLTVAAILSWSANQA